MAPSISLRGAVALLGNFPALSGVDLQVSRGEVVAVRGPNGAGKTSLLRVCAGLAAVSSGEVVVLGHDLVADRRAVRRHVGLLGHESHLYEDLSARENVMFQVKAARCDVARVAPALESLGLGGRLARLKVSAMSAGQRRRTVVAALVARRPELWLLDEPHAGLDAEAREILDSTVVEASSQGSTVVIVSHEQTALDALATSIVSMAGGRVVSRVDSARVTGGAPPVGSPPVEEPFRVA